jgi:hypothetical protein
LERIRGSLKEDKHPEALGKIPRVHEANHASSGKKVNALR